MYIVSKTGNLSNLNLLAKARIYSSILSSIIPKFPLSFIIDGTIQYKSPINANRNNNIIKSELFLADIFNLSLKQFLNGFKVYAIINEITNKLTTSLIGVKYIYITILSITMTIAIIAL